MLCKIYSFYIKVSNFMSFGRSTTFGQRPLKSFSSVCPSVTKFSQDWIISFSDIVHDVS